MSETVQRYPFDFDTLKKGDVIPVDVLEDRSGFKYGSRGYDLALLQFRGRIFKELADRGTIVTVRSEKGALRILTDLEASSYLGNERTRDFVRSKRHHLQFMGVDSRDFSEKQRGIYERGLFVSGKQLTGEGGGRKEGFKLIAHERKTPGMQQPQLPDTEEKEQSDNPDAPVADVS